MYLDAMEYGQAIESELGQYLIPSEDASGIMPGTWAGFDPRITERSHLPHMINPNVATMQNRGKRNRIEHVPDRGIAMVGDMIGWMLTSLAHWKEPVKPDIPMLDVPTVFAGPEVRAPKEVLPLTTPLRPYFQTHREPKYDYRNHDPILNRAVDLLLEVRTEIVKFVGDDHWVIHYYSRQGLWDYAVEKTVDFRIYDWERRMQSGEWS